MFSLTFHNHISQGIYQYENIDEHIRKYVLKIKISIYEISEKSIWKKNINVYNSFWTRNVKKDLINIRLIIGIQ